MVRSGGVNSFEMKICVCERIRKIIFIGGCFCVGFDLCVISAQSANSEDDTIVVEEVATDKDDLVIEEVEGKISDEDVIKNEPEKAGEDNQQSIEENESEVVDREVEGEGEEPQEEGGEDEEGIKIEKLETKVEKNEIQTFLNDTPNNENDDGETEESGNEFEIVISEVVIGDENGSKNEFVELYNFSKKEIDLKGFSLRKRTKSGSESNLVSSSKFFGTIGPEKFFVIKNHNFEGIIVADLSFSGSSYSIAKDNQLYLEDDEGNLVDAIGWGKCKQDCKDEIMFDELKEEQSLSARLNNNPKQKYAKKFEITNFKTPGQKNIFSSEIEYPRNVVFSEILSNPEGKDNDAEWIELRNENDSKINLTNWIIENGSGKRFKLKAVEILRKDFAVIEIRDTSFVIRNSEESLYLINPAEKVVSEVSITQSAQSGISFGWTSKRGWSWNRKQTPGKENVANNIPKIRVKKSKKIYKNIYAEFDASKTSDKNHDELKFVWDFGDGHKSYLEKTKHKYEKKGKFRASLTVKDGFEKIIKEFRVDVESFPRKKIRITSLLPNPKGKDSGNEMIEIENLSSKKINLISFYIATGKKFSSLVRHKILEDFILKPGEKKFISNEKLCKFSLLNKSGKVKLFYPDGKGAFELEYEREKIGDDDTFKFNGDRWEWIAADLPARQGDVIEIKKETEISRDVRDALNLITHNNKLKICETYLKMQIENWRYKRENPLKFFQMKGLKGNAKKVSFELSG